MVLYSACLVHLSRLLDTDGSFSSNEWVNQKIGADFVITDVVEDCSSKEHILDVTEYAYSLTENVMTPKKSRKGKRFTGSDLTPQEKEFSLVFTLNAEIIRPS